MCDVTSNSAARRSYYESSMERTNKQCDIGMALFVSAKSVFPYKFKIMDPDLYGRLYGEIVSSGFLDNFTQKVSPGPENYIDASRHKLQYVIKTN